MHGYSDHNHGFRIGQHRKQLRLPLVGSAAGMAMSDNLPSYGESLDPQPAHQRQSFQRESSSPSVLGSSRSAWPYAPGLRVSENGIAFSHPPPASSSSSMNEKGNDTKPGPSRRPRDAAAPAAGSRIPEEAQKALAPLSIVSESKDIQGVYAIELSHTTAFVSSGSASTLVSPTCNLATTGKNDIDITLYFRDPRASTSASSHAPPLPSRPGQAANAPLEIAVNSKKGKIRLVVPDRLSNWPLRIICTLEGVSLLLSSW